MIIVPVDDQLDAQAGYTQDSGHRTAVAWIVREEHPGRYVASRAEQQRLRCMQVEVWSDAACPEKEEIACGDASGKTRAGLACWKPLRRVALSLHGGRQVGIITGGEHGIVERHVGAVVAFDGVTVASSRNGLCVVVQRQAVAVRRQKGPDGGSGIDAAV